MVEPAHQNVGEIQTYFAQFAASFPDLALYSRLAEMAAQDPEVASLLLAAAPGQARPVLLFAAVHDLILLQPELALGRWYSSVTPIDALDPHDPWPTFRETCIAFRTELESVIATRATQTNEVNRSVLVALLVAAACRDVPDMPVSLVELGTSAGLLLGVDRYRVTVGDTIVGDPTSAVTCEGIVRGPNVPDLCGFPAHIRARVGIDLAPIAVDDLSGVRWLEACLWPDQPWRIERFRRAVSVTRAHPPRLVTGDYVELLPSVIDSLDDQGHLVVFHCWSLTYVARARRESLAKTLAHAASEGRHVSWLSAEPPGCVPGLIPPLHAKSAEEVTPDTVLGMRRWRQGHDLGSVALGWSHPHGNWLQLGEEVFSGDV